MQLGHKIKLNPTNKQITSFKKGCGIARLAWNWGLSNWNENYKNGIKNSGLSLKKEFNAIKKSEYPFVYEVTKYACQQPFIKLQEAWNRYFEYKKAGKGRKVGQPKLKKKNKSKDSFYIGGDVVKVKNKQVWIPNLGYVKMREELRFEGRVSSVTISREADNWFISFAIEPVISFNTCENQASIGVDVGIKSLVTLSNGIKISSPKPLKKNLRKLKKLSRQLSKKQHSRGKGDLTKQSENYKKQKLKVAKLHVRIANIRKDTLHKVTKFLVSNFQYIAIEDLNVQGMMANRKLSRALSDIGFYEFRRQLEYKAKMYGNEIFVVDRWYPSSKTCSGCGVVKKTLLLSERIFKCEDCGLEIDRDLNAAINITAIAQAKRRDAGRDRLGVSREGQIPQALREFTTEFGVNPAQTLSVCEMTALLDLYGLKTSIALPTQLAA